MFFRVDFVCLFLCCKMRSGSVRPVGVKAILKGRLHLQLANVGHRVDVNVMKAGTMPVKAAKVVVQEDGSGAFLGGSVNLGTRPSGKSLSILLYILGSFTLKSRLA